MAHINHHNNERDTHSHFYSLASPMPRQVRLSAPEQQSNSNPIDSQVELETHIGVNSPTDCITKAGRRQKQKKQTHTDLYPMMVFKQLFSYKLYSNNTENKNCFFFKVRLLKDMTVMICKIDLHQPLSVTDITLYVFTQKMPRIHITFLYIVEYNLFSQIHVYI